MKLSKITVLILTLLALLATQAPAIIQDMPDKGNILTEVSFPKDEGVILLPVTIAGKKYYFLLQTGLQYNIYDSSLKSFIGPSIGKRGGRFNSHLLYDSPEAKLGTLSLKTKSPVFVHNLKRLGYVIGRRIHGIIGMSFLKDYSLKIDFDKSKVILYKSLRKIDTSNYVSNDLLLRYHLPLIKCTLPDGGKTWFVMDTGSYEDGSLTKKIFNSLLVKKQIKLLKNDVIPVKLGLLSRFAFGLFNHSKIVFSNRGLLKIGGSLLSQYNILFDFPNKKVYLKKRKIVKSINILVETGMVLVRSKRTTVIRKVKKNGPASKAGLKRGDRILAVDDKGSDNFTLFMLRRYFKRVGKKIKIKVRRKGKVMEFQFMPKAYAF